MFHNQNIVLATKHCKENVLKPLLESQLGLKCFVPDDFETDVFGTFSGEVDRTNDALETVRAKCLEAMKQYNFNLGIASEGSFGPHPNVFFAAADEEILIFIDIKNNIEIVVKELSLETNFGGKVIESTAELIDFANEKGFPSHGLILKRNKDNFEDILKDFESELELVKGFLDFKNKFGHAYVETDMRAMKNPTRMKVIESVCKKLVEKIKSCCPQCHFPGFGIVASTSGLRCELCNMPTKSTLSFVYQCKNCNFELEKMYPNNKTFEDPAFCDFCNP